ASAAAYLQHVEAWQTAAAEGAEWLLVLPGQCRVQEDLGSWDWNEVFDVVTLEICRLHDACEAWDMLLLSEACGDSLVSTPTWRPGDQAYCVSATGMARLLSSDLGWLAPHRCMGDLLATMATGQDAQGDFCEWTLLSMPRPWRALAVCCGVEVPATSDFPQVD
ncbi:unnamed protein product, partial [Polarella glacialis]